MNNRIATPYMFAQGVDVMLKKQVRISQTELQLANGNRILRPSDDAAASVKLLDLKESKSRIQQFQRNADAATARLSQEESALNGIGNLLQRVRELTVQGNNGTLSPADRAAIGKEVRQQVDNFLQLANTRDANGEYLFGGYRSDTPPLVHDGVGGFSYQGDEGQRVLQIGDARRVATGDPGSVFMNIPAAAGGSTDIGAVLYRVASNFTAGNRDPNALDDLDQAIERISITRSSVGARMNAIDEQKTANESFGTAVEQVRSNLEDLDYAKAVSRFKQQLAALQASQQSFMKIQNLNLFNFLR
jgi:flagellar hook-associated protein 3 FlgL